MAIRNSPPPKKTTGKGVHVKRTTPRKHLGSLKGGVKSGGVGGAKGSKGSKGAATASHASEAHEAGEAHEVADVSAGGMDFDADPRGGGGGSGFGGQQDKESILGARKTATTPQGELRRAPDDGDATPRAVTGFETVAKNDTPFGGNKTEGGEQVPGSGGDAQIPSDKASVEGSKSLSTESLSTESLSTESPSTESPSTESLSTESLSTESLSTEGRVGTGSVKIDAVDRPSTREGVALTATGSAVGTAVARSTGGKAVGDTPPPKADGNSGVKPPLAKQTHAPVGDKDLGKATAGMKKSEVGREAIAVTKGDPLERTIRKAVDAQQESDIQDSVKEDTKGVALSGGRATSKPPFSDVPQGADDVEPMDTAEINAEARADEANNGLPLVKKGDERKPSMNAPPDIQLAVTDMANVAGSADPGLGVQDIADSMKAGTDTDGEGEGEEEMEEEEEEAEG